MHLSSIATEKITAFSVKIKGAGLTDGKKENSPLHISVHKAHPKNLFNFFFKSVFIIHFINKKNIRYTKAYVSLLN